MRQLFTYVAVISCFFFLACKADSSKDTFVRFNIGGPLIVDHVEIKANLDDMDNPDALASVILYPETEDDPETLIISYQDFNTNYSFTMIVPTTALKSTKVFDQDSPWGVGVASQEDNYVMSNHLVNITIEKLKRSNGPFGIFLGVEELEVRFNGTLNYENPDTPGEPPISHFLNDGVLHYYGPL